MFFHFYVPFWQEQKYIFLEIVDKKLFEKQEK